MGQTNVIFRYNRRPNQSLFYFQLVQHFTLQHYNLLLKYKNIQVQEYEYYIIPIPFEPRCQFQVDCARSLMCDFDVLV